MTLSENPAVASVWPSATFSPAPTPIAVPAAASQDATSRTLQGPSATEWARHRETIVSLYRQYPLKRVSEIMKRQHGFSASKRMYDKRFREWNIFKNVNSDGGARAGRRDICDESGRGGLHEVARRASKSQQRVRRNHETNPPVPSTGSLDSQSAPCPSATRPGRGSITISDLIMEPDIPEETTLVNPPDREGPLQVPSSSSGEPCETTRTPVSDERLPSQDGPAARCAPPFPRHSLAAYKAQLQSLAESPRPSLSPDSKTRIMGVITLKLREYCDWQLSNIPQGVLPDDYLGHRRSDESTRYWNTIKDAIYLVKISAGSLDDPDHRPDQRAWSAFAQAGRLAAGAMTTHPFDFLRNLFATLSPANTSARPELRGILLQFLTSEARTSLSPSHPVTLICQELQRDEDCQEVSRRSLQCMLDVFRGRLLAPRSSRAITFKLLDSLATLLRRSGEFHAGLRIILELRRSCRPLFGPQSDQARTVENELAHFYMLTDECDLALRHCMSVVTRPPPPPPGQGHHHHHQQQQQQHWEEEEDEAPAFYRDEISARAMEDIAEIHQRRGEMEQCITWLERAASIALIVWGPKSIATGHLIDKMTSLQRQFGSDMLRGATLWEAAIGSTGGS